MWCSQKQLTIVILQQNTDTIYLIWTLVNMNFKAGKLGRAHFFVGEEVSHKFNSFFSNIYDGLTSKYIYGYEGDDPENRWRGCEVLREKPIPSLDLRITIILGFVYFASSSILRLFVRFCDLKLVTPARNLGAMIGRCTTTAR